MKTLRSTLIITMLAVCFTTVSASTQKETKIADGNLVRAKVKNLVRSSDITEVGSLNILFKVNNNRIKVLSIEGNNLQLNKQVKSLLESHKVNLKGQIGYYEVKITINGDNPTIGNKDKQPKLRQLIAETK